MKRTKRSMKEMYDPTMDKKYWIFVSFDSNYRNGMLMGFDSKEDMDNLIYDLENIADYTIFNIELYGFTTQVEVENYFNDRRIIDMITVAKGLRNTSNTIEYIYNKLTKNESTKKTKKSIKEGYDSYDFSIRPSSFDRTSFGRQILKVVTSQIRDIYDSIGEELEYEMDRGLLVDPIDMPFDIQIDGRIKYDPITGKGEIFYRD
jgi:hypothetical protein